MILYCHALVNFCAVSCLEKSIKIVSHAMLSIFQKITVFLLIKKYYFIKLYNSNLSSN